MQVINDFDNEFIFHESVSTVGTFDGIHCGHVEIIRKMKMAAEDLSASTVVVTFSPHPRSVVTDDFDIKLLTPLEEKLRLFEELGINYVLVINFTKDFSKKTYEEFFDEILVQKVKSKHLVIGYDHKFGKGRDGDINKLVEYSKAKKIDMTIVGPKEIDSAAVSSTKIRQALLEGNISSASRMLGRFYTVEGVVAEGSKRGRTLGFPTANLDISSSEKLLPKNGVYFVKVNVLEKEYYGVANIGLRPTFNNAKEPITEVHILEFNMNIYGQRISLSFIERIRDEKKFSSKEELEKQINSDIEKVNELIKNINN